MENENKYRNNLIYNQNVVIYLRSLRIGWLDHIMRMGDQRPTEKLLKRKPIGSRRVGRSKMKWENNVINDQKKKQVTNRNWQK